MKKILSIDGGGLRGIIPALVLAEMEARTNQRVAALFDLMAGTSTGGILSLALAIDGGRGSPKYSAADLVELYETRGGEIFPTSLFQEVAGLVDEKYPSEPLETILQEYFGDTLLEQALKPVLISSYDLEKREPLFFKSWRTETGGVLMRSVARATSAAPTYFRPALVRIALEKHALIDGGVFVNNPAISAYAEARRLFPQEDSFILVSLGTGTATTPFSYEETYHWGKLQWVRPILDIVFDGVSDAVDYQLKMILEDRFFRFQTELKIAKHDMDDASPENLEKLKDEARQLLDSHGTALEKVCGLLQAGT